MATEAIADAQICKMSVLNDQNMILLMQTIDSSATPTAQEYFRLRQEEELEKLRQRLAGKAERERREHEDGEARKRMEVAREREVAEAEACENRKTMRQMRNVSGHIDGRHDFDVELEEFESDHD
jgi:DNA-directed RNA polymerase